MPGEGAVSSGLVAYARRQRVRSRVRRGAVRLVHGLSRLLSKLRPPADPDHLEVFPPVATDAEAADVCARLNWYLAGCDVPITFAGSTEALVFDPDAAPWMDPELVQPPPALRASSPARASHVLLHSVRPSTVLRKLPQLGASTVVDPSFHGLTDCSNWFALRARLVRDASDVGRRAAEALLATRTDNGTALVLGTGPAATSLPRSALDAEVRIVCNSAVRDRGLIQSLRPQVIAFGDPMFHFGPSRYAAAFRADLLWAAEASDAFLVVPAYEAGLLVHHHPSLAPRIVPLALAHQPWGWPTTDDLSVRATGNVLTELMLPVAFSLASRVQIAGCDGREPGERYFWRHDKAIQYSDELMGTVFAAHPGFFRDEHYRDYYEKHCAELEDFLSMAESQGRTVECVTPSFIPALKRRETAG